MNILFKVSNSENRLAYLLLNKKESYSIKILSEKFRSTKQENSFSPQ